MDKGFNNPLPPDRRQYYSLSPEVTEQLDSFTEWHRGTNHRQLKEHAMACVRIARESAIDRFIVDNPSVARLLNFQKVGFVRTRDGWLLSAPPVGTQLMTSTRAWNLRRIMLATQHAGVNSTSGRAPI